MKVGLKKKGNRDIPAKKNLISPFSAVSHDQLKILPYNRAVRDLNGLTKEQFLDRVKEYFEINEFGVTPYSPTEKASFGMCRTVPGT